MIQGAISAAILFAAAMLAFSTRWPAAWIGGVVLIITGVAVLIEDLGLWLRYRSRLAEQQKEQWDRDRYEEL